MAFLLPLFRVAGLVMVAPVFGSRLIPARVKVALALAVTMVVAPALPAPQVGSGWLGLGFAAMQETLVGLAMGFMLQMIFDALVIAGQTIAMTMGLGFAMLVDPQRGVAVPVLSQFFVILGILIFLSLDGHLALLQTLADSFRLLPVGALPSTDGLWSLIGWGTQMFAGAVSIALPAVVAILVVNIAFGVMSRAAPTLNLFAIGFPAALLVGFIVLLLNLDNVASAFSALLDVGLANVDIVLAR